jgi:thiamine pyrophosphokinase
MKSLIITGGQGPGLKVLESLSFNADFVVVADSGLDSIGGTTIEPDYIVGDFDSLSDTTLLNRYKKADILTYSSEKDETDTELALNICIKKKSEQITIAGGGGGRLDHILGVLYLFTRTNVPDAWYTAKEIVFNIKPGIQGRFRVVIGSQVSVFPLMAMSQGMKSEGLAWPLKDLIWEPGYYGISNRALESEISVTSGTSALIVVLSPGSERIL